VPLLSHSFIVVFDCLYFAEALLYNVIIWCSLHATTELNSKPYAYYLTGMGLPYVLISLDTFCPGEFSKIDSLSSFLDCNPSD